MRKVKKYEFYYLPLVIRFIREVDLHRDINKINKIKKTEFYNYKKNEYRNIYLTANYRGNERNALINIR